MKNVIVVTFALSILVALAPGLGSLKASYVAETDIRALQEDLADSHHTPLCVLVRRTGSKFEKRIAELWYDSSRPDTRDFASWRLAALNVTKVKHLPGYLLVNSEAPKSPFLRCFLGPTLQHDLMPTQLKPKQWLQWLNQLASQYRHQVQGSVEMIETSARQHRFTLVVFPTSHQHHQLEQAVFKLVGALFKETTIKVVVIHPTSVNLREIREEYHVTSVPSVLLIEKDRTSERKVSLYSIHDVTVNKFETDLRARLVPAHQFNMTDFQADVLTVKTSERYRPYLIGFYAHWEKDTAVFLTFLRLAAEEFLSMGASLRFGLVDAARNPSVISQFMSPGCLQHLPFLALFQRVDGTSSVNQTELLLLRPSPFTVYSALLEAGLTLTNMEHQPIRYQPYGHNTQVCLAREGPTGDTCAANSSAWLYPPDFLSTFLNYPDTVSAADRGEDQAGVGIPVVLGADRDTTQSHSNSDSQWIITVRVMVFIQEPCRSCEQNLPVFQQVYQQLHANDSCSVGLVNCSVTPELCEKHHVRGFPTVLAFRSHNAAGLRCSRGRPLDDSSQRSIRQDYHGVITVPAIMKWIKRVSSHAVTPLYFSQPSWTERQSVQLVATVVPRDSNFLPLPPNKDKGFFYSTRCFRLACERLFGLASCYTAHSPDVPASQFDNSSTDFVITQVVFRRRDGIEVTIMRLGQSLAALLEEETDGTLHLFHQHHSYGLQQKQRCEEDHGQCTQFLEKFTRDHLRLPVTPLTSDILHSHNDFLFGNNMPVLLAFVDHDTSEDFLKVVQNVAYSLYQKVVVASLDVNMYAAWAGQFVPRNYNKLRAESVDRDELSTYPRLCLFYWTDHSRAAFYPPVTLAHTALADQTGVSSIGQPSRSDLLSEHLLVQFVRDFLEDPAGKLMETEQF